MRDALRDFIEQLVARHGTTERVDLNDIAEVIGRAAVSYDEVDQIIAELEARGCAVGGPPSPRELVLLGDVLTAARRLSGELGRQPTVAEIAAAIEQPSFVVRRAVETGGAFTRAATTPARRTARRGDRGCPSASAPRPGRTFP
jgi:hypothetical protein